MGGRNHGDTGKNFDHHKQWMEAELQHLAKHFGIDLLCHANIQKNARRSIPKLAARDLSFSSIKRFR